jgi:prepilin-type processing-associated H-X9-DG protein
MSEEERKEEEKKAKISKLAMISVVLAVLGLLIVPFGSVRQYPHVLKDVFFTTAGVMGLIALIFAYVSLVRIPKSAIALISFGILVYLVPILVRIFFSLRRNREVWGGVFLLQNLFLFFSFVAAFTIACAKYEVRGSPGNTVSSVTRKTLPLTSAFLATICTFLWLVSYIPRSTAFYNPCSRNLNQISRALQIYANDYDNQFPEPNQWCDLLLKNGYVKPEHLVNPSLIVRCPYTGQIILYRPSPKKGRCHFAMNPNCKLTSPSNTVLLFETDEGWNKFGGPELLTFDNHGGKGCNILFSDGKIRFIKPEDAINLIWKLDE